MKWRADARDSRGRKHDWFRWRRSCRFGGRQIGDGGGGLLGLRRLPGLGGDGNSRNEEARSENEQKRGRLGPENSSTATKPTREPETENLGHPLTPLTAQRPPRLQE